jgi:hypothetical protein
MDGRTDLERTTDAYQSLRDEVLRIAQYGDETLNDENRDRQILAENLISRLREAVHRVR